MRTIQLIARLAMVLAVTYILVVLILRSEYSPHQGYPAFVYGEVPRLHYGDSLAWTAPDYDDAHWGRGANRDTNAVFWIRNEVLIPETSGPWNEAGIAMEVLSSYDFFWDGQLIGRNGEVGTNREAERPGRYQQLFRLSDSLVRPGRHVLAWRCSNFHLPGRIRYFGFRMGDYDRLLSRPLIFTASIHILAGIFLVVALYYLLIYFISYREAPFLLFGLSCVVFFLLLLFEYLKFYYWYPYPFHYDRLMIIEGLTLLFAACLTTFFLYRFEVPYKILVLLFLGVTHSAIVPQMPQFPGHDGRILGISLFTFSVIALIIFWAYHKGKEGSEAALLGIAPFVWLPVYYDLILFIGFFNLVIFNLYALSVRQRTIRQLQEEAQLRSARLEVELLRKHLKPHYLMNTLTSLMEWIEQEPPKGVRFVSALAAEFRLLNRMTDKQLVPVEEEIALCRSHLEIMSYRKGIAYELEVQLLIPGTLVPPAILFTLVENGVVHNRPCDGRLLQILECKSLGSWIECRLWIEGPPKKEKVPVVAGTGFRYLRARLEESFPGQWEFDSRPQEGGWLSVVRFPLRKE